MNPFLTLEKFHLSTGWSYMVLWALLSFPVLFRVGIKEEKALELRASAIICTCTLLTCSKS